jgi:hypothetical protein
MKKTLEEINKTLTETKSQIKIGDKYVHYKSSESIYEIVDLVIIEATEEVGVIYKPNYGELTEVKFLRPLKEFLEEVEFEENFVQRFRKIIN